VVGIGLLRIAKAWFDEATVSRVFVPLIADWQGECRGLIGARRLMCSWRAHRAFVATFVLTFARDLFRALPAGLGGTVFVSIEAAATVAALLFTYVYQLTLAAPGTDLRTTMGPMALLALPLAVCATSFGMMTHSRWAPLYVRRALVRLAPIHTAEMWFIAVSALPGVPLYQQALMSLLPLVAIAIGIAAAERRVVDKGIDGMPTPSA
jgi:hypothetical protein